MLAKGIQSAAPAITRMAGANPYITAAAAAVTVANAIYQNMRGDQGSQLPRANIIGGQPAQAEPVYDESSLLDPIPQPQVQQQQIMVRRPVSIQRQITGSSGNVTFVVQPLISPEFINQDLQLTDDQINDLFRAIPRSDRNEFITNIIRNRQLHAVGQPRLLDQIVADHFLTEIFGGVSSREFSGLDIADLALLRAVFNNVVLGGLQIGSQTVNLSSTRAQIVQAMQQVINNATDMTDLHISQLPPRIIFLILCIKRRKENKLDRFISKYLAARHTDMQNPPISTDATPQEMITTMAIHISLATHYHLFENVFAEIGNELGIPREGSDLSMRKLGFHVIMTALSIDSIDNREGLIEQLLNRIRGEAVFNQDDLTRILEEHGIFIDVMRALGSIASRLQNPEGIELMAPQASEEERKAVVSEQTADNLQSRLYWQQNEIAFISNHLSQRILLISGVMNGNIPIEQLSRDPVDEMAADVQRRQGSSLLPQQNVANIIEEELKEPLLPPAQRIAENNNPIPAAEEIKQASESQQIRMLYEPIIRDRVYEMDEMVRLRGQFEERMNRRLRNQFLVNLGGISSLLTPEVMNLIDLIQRALTYKKFKYRHDPDPEDVDIEDKKPKVVIKENQPLDLPPMKFVVKKELELKRRDLEDETPIENIIKNQDELPPVKPRRGRPRKPIPISSEISAA